jgi:hypothetical protein
MGFEGINLLILSICAGIYLAILAVLGFFSKFSKSGEHYFTSKPLRRVAFFDFAKGIAIMAIIVIHTAYFMHFFCLSFLFAL